MHRLRFDSLPSVSLAIHDRPREMQPVLLDVLAERLELVGRHHREQVGGRMHLDHVAPGLRLLGLAHCAPLDGRLLAGAVVVRRGGVLARSISGSSTSCAAKARCNRMSSPVRICAADVPSLSSRSHISPMRQRGDLGVWVSVHRPFLHAIGCRRPAGAVLIGRGRFPEVRRCRRCFPLLFLFRHFLSLPNRRATT